MAKLTGNNERKTKGKIMNYIKRNVIITLGILLTISLVFNGCFIQGTPVITLLIENQTDETLTIYEEYDLIGNVKPAETIRYKTTLASDRWLIIAKNVQGEIVFSKKFVFEELQKIDEGIYKAIIPPFSNNSTNSENISSQ